MWSSASFFSARPAAGETAARLLTVAGNVDSASGATAAARPSANSQPRACAKETGGRRYQTHWGKEWTWLHYDADRDAAFCRVCREAEELQILNAERRKGGAFTNTGFRRWRNGPEVFRDHENSAAHKTAVRWLISSEKEPKILNMISDATKRQMKVARTGVTGIVEAVGCRRPGATLPQATGRYRKLHSSPSLDQQA